MERDIRLPDLRLPQRRATLASMRYGKETSWSTSGRPSAARSRFKAGSPSTWKAFARAAIAAPVTTAGSWRAMRWCARTNSCNSIARPTQRYRVAIRPALYENLLEDLRRHGLDEVQLAPDGLRP